MSEDLNRPDLSGVQDNNLKKPDGETWEKTVAEKDYLELQAFATKARQAEIEAQLKLAEVNPQSILEIKDSKVQNKVIEEKYWLKNMAELKAIYWDDFFAKKESEDVDEISQLKKKVRILESRTEYEKVENAIKDLRKANPQLFENENSEDKLREEIGYLSSSLSPEERVKRAATNTFGNNYIDSTQLAYKMLQTLNWWATWEAATKKSKEDEFNQRKDQLKKLILW